MGEYGGEADPTRLLVDRSGLHGRDFVPAERLADDIEPRGERGVAEGLIGLARVGCANGGSERLFRIGEFGLRLGERGRDRPDRVTGPLHGSSPHREDRS